MMNEQKTAIQNFQPNSHPDHDRGITKDLICELVELNLLQENCTQHHDVNMQHKHL